MKLLTAAEIAAMIRMNRRTVAEKLTKRPDFPRPYRPGRTYLWDADEVADWIERSRVQPSNARTKSSTAGA